MVWEGEDIAAGQAQLLQIAGRYVGQTRRLTQGMFRGQLRALRRSFQTVHTDAQLRQAVEAVLTARRREWMRFFRRTYFSIGLVMARRAAPPTGESDEATAGESRDVEDDPSTVGVSWGDPGNEWWASAWPDRSEGEPWFDPWTRQTHDYVDRQGAKKVTQINRTTRGQIQEAIDEGLARGEGIPDLKKRIDDLHLEQIIPRRSEVIARTESLNAARAGAFNSVKARGIEHKTRKSWLSVGDRRTRTTHLEAEAERNQEIPYDQPFRVRSPSTGRMQELLLPGDASMGADASNVILCRCDLLKHVRDPSRGGF